MSARKLVWITVAMPSGDGEAFLIPEVSAMLRQGWEICIVPRSPTGSVFNRDAAHFEDFCVSQPLLSWEIVTAALGEFLMHPIAALRALAILFRCLKPRTLGKNLATYPKGLWLARLARRWGASHIHAHWLLTTATMAMVASTVSRIPWSCTAHRGDIADNNLLAYKVSNASFVRFISENGRTMAQSLGATIGTNTPVIHMGVVLPTVEEAPATQNQCARILCAANLIPVKGHTYLLQALVLLKERGVACSLDLAGSGGLEEELRAQVKALSLDDRVRFLGYLSHDQLLDDYRTHRIDITVLPSIESKKHEHEGIPVSLMEAMAYEVPVISTTTGGIPELLRDGAGMLVPPKDPKALADALEQLIRDRELRRALAVAGRRRVEKDFSIDGTTAMLAKYIEAAIRNRTPADPTACLPQET